MQGKPILDVARQMAAEADYCVATGLHAMSPDEDKSPKTPISPAGYLSVDTYCTLALLKMVLR